MDSVNKTLYIPLYGKSYVSKRGLFLDDTMAEQIWAAEGFALKGKSKSKWLAYYMGIRAAVFDEWVRLQMKAMPDAAVIHIGCGMDSRVLRVGTGNHKWYDVDFPAVIRERKRYFAETETYHMLASDVTDKTWLEKITEGKCAIVVMEGVSMYLTSEERRVLMESLGRWFERVALLVDCYTPMAAKLTRYSNPINDVGVTRVYGVEDPLELQQGGFIFAGEHDMTPQRYIEELKGSEKDIFRKLYAGKFAKKLYRLYEYRKT